MKVVFELEFEYKCNDNIDGAKIIKDELLKSIPQKFDNGLVILNSFSILYDETKSKKS